MVDIMDEGVDVTDPYGGSGNVGVRQLWRRNRNAAYRQAYEEINSEPHAASVGQAKEDLDILLDKTDPPNGMGWVDFGTLWDLHPEHPYTPVLRKQSVEAEWNKKLEQAKQNNQGTTWTEDGSGASN